MDYQNHKYSQPPDYKKSEFSNKLYDILLLLLDRVNKKSNTAINWLYALSFSGFAFALLHPSLQNIYYTLVFRIGFGVCLMLVIFINGLEYWRATTFQKSFVKYQAKFYRDEITWSEFSEIEKLDNNYYLIITILIIINHLVLVVLGCCLIIFG